MAKTFDGKNIVFAVSSESAYQKVRNGIKANGGSSEIYSGNYPGSDYYAPHEAFIGAFFDRHYDHNNGNHVFYTRNHNNPSSMDVVVVDARKINGTAGCVTVLGILREQGIPAIVMWDESSGVSPSDIEAVNPQATIIDTSFLDNPDFVIKQIAQKAELAVNNLISLAVIDKEKEKAKAEAKLAT